MSAHKLPKSRENERVFVEHVLELLHELGDVKARAMFGGYGIYCDQVMIALITENVLYFKVDDTSRSLFATQGCRPFEYLRKGRSEPIRMSYYEAPADALERASALCAWGRHACDAAERAAASRKRRTS